MKGTSMATIDQAQLQTLVDAADAARQALDEAEVSCDAAKAIVDQRTQELAYAKLALRRFVGGAAGFDQFSF